jgi:hypothetical protein
VNYRGPACVGKPFSIGFLSVALDLLPQFLIIDPVILGVLPASVSTQGGFITITGLFLQGGQYIAFFANPSRQSLFFCQTVSCMLALVP